MKEHIPTFVGIYEKRKLAKKNRLPKHLRPISLWPIAGQMALNIGILSALLNVIVNKDEYLTDAGPAISMVVCLLLLIYTVISAVHLKKLHTSSRGAKLARINFWLMLAALISWPACVAVYLP